MKAGCGTGKTVAAYLWAAANHPTRRLYFCYPTTGTATEGFKDYLFEPDGELGGLGARLFHSRRDVDFEIILGTGADSQNPEADMAARLESLEAWSTPIVACTVDTVLGLVQNNKRGLFAWPALAQVGLRVRRDPRLRRPAVRGAAPVPARPARAALPLDDREPAEGRARRPCSGRSGTSTASTSNRSRGRRNSKNCRAITSWLRAGNDPLPLIKRELQDGGKVLWVCNTVGRVMDAADRAKDLGPLIYHSRFRYQDRVERHKRVVEAFTPEHQGPAAGHLQPGRRDEPRPEGLHAARTDLAPVPALIQRLGRLNRQAKRGRPDAAVRGDRA